MKQDNNFSHAVSFSGQHPAMSTISAFNSPGSAHNVHPFTNGLTDGPSRGTPNQHVGLAGFLLFNDHPGVSNLAAHTGSTDVYNAALSGAGNATLGTNTAHGHVSRAETRQDGCTVEITHWGLTETFTFEVDQAFHGEKMGIILGDGYGVTFIIDTSSTAQTIVDKGYGVITGPREKMLWRYGYVG